MHHHHPAVHTDLARIVGVERFASYLSAQNGSMPHALRLYSWNIEASAALLGTASAMEVGVRNAMHHRLTEMFGRVDWWEAAPLGPGELEQVRKAEMYLDRRKGPGAWTAGHVIAELRASFWEALLVNRYHASLWDRGLAAAFPHHEGRRSDLRARMERLRLLRNRAAHHEPIFARDLRVDYAYLCDVAGYVSPHLHAWIASHSRLPDIIAERPATIAGLRIARF